MSAAPPTSAMICWVRARDPDRLLGGQRQRLVEGVGVEALGATEHARQRLNRDPHDVI